MSGVLVDACGWVAVVEAGINIDLTLADSVGPVDLKVTSRVLDELQRIRKSGSKSLLLNLLRQRAEVVKGTGEETHTDDEILNIALARGWPVLTVDKKLKQRLSDSGIAFIEVSGISNLRLCE
jgi:rRNA-processing protein FCF1